MPSPRTLTLPALLAAVAMLAGCGGGTNVFRTDRPILRLTLDEYRILPSNIVVKAGRIKFVVHNAGRLTHNLVVQIPGKTPADAPTEILGGRVDTMQPGETANPIKLTLAPGVYRLVCTIANHDDLGQVAKLTVEG